MSIRALNRELRDVLRMAQKPLDPNTESVFIGFRLVETMASSLDELAEKRASNRSELIREAISRYLADEEVAASA